jgi:hypothetical protein
MSYSMNLIALLLIGAAAFPAAVLAASPREGVLAAPLSNEETWQRLPKPEKGSGQPLPSWARMLAGELSRSTAAFLQLDFAQRTKSPVDPGLRAAMRWVAAHANRCAYAETYAVADARVPAWTTRGSRPWPATATPDGPTPIGLH